MNEQSHSEPAANLPPTDDHLAANQSEFLTPDSGRPLPAGGSVLKALAATLPLPPNIHLRDPAHEPVTPVVCTSSPELPAGMAPGSRLQLLGEIGRGGMGAILKGRDVDLGRDIAVKVLLETHQGKTEFVQRFVEEAQIAGQLQHPGVTPVYELGQFADQRPYFTMKLLKGKTLAARLAERREPADERAQLVGIFGQVCQTLAYAHARGVIHRDLKPSNVMVGMFGEVQVMDWGLAKVLREGGAADERKARAAQAVSVIRTQRAVDSGTPEFGSHTQAGSVLGTPAYMAPEQARGDVELVDERADVFGLGAILCEILTGQPPYTGNKAEVARKAQLAALDDAYARLDRCGADGEMVGLARRCLAAEPWDRPHDAGKVAEEVTAYQNSVAERLRQAELAHAAESARAEEARATAAQERKAREAAQAKVAAERRARRLTLALAAAVLLAVTLGGLGVRYVELDRIARTAAVEARINTALQEAVQLRGKAQAAPEGELAPWNEALAAARKAAALLEPEVDPALRTQVETLLAEVTTQQQQAETASHAAEQDRRLLDRLLDIRSAKGDDRDGFRTEADYAEAFREAGIDVTALSPEEAGAKIHARPPAVALAAALDDWAANRRDRRKDPAGAKRLSAAAQHADPDAWRGKLRDAVDQSDRVTRLTALREVAKTAPLEELGAITLDLLGTAIQGAGDLAAAEKVLREAQRRHPGDVWVNHDLGRLLEKVGRTEEAIRYYMMARAIRPETAHRLAHALENKGEGEAAIQVFQDLVRLRPKNGAHLCCMGNSLEERGRPKEAKETYGAAVAALQEEIRQNPDEGSFYNSLGAALEGLGKNDDALAAYQKSSKLQPDAAMPRYNIGHLSEIAGKYQEALAAYQETIRLDPLYVEAYVNSGRILMDLGRRDESVAMLREAVKVRPDFAKAHANLAWILSRQGKGDEALVANREAVRCNPDYIQAYLNLAEGLERRGQYAEALVYTRKAAELVATRPGSRLPAAEWVRKAELNSELENKLAAFLTGKFKARDNEQRIALASVCYAKKFPASAADLFAEAFAADPKLADDLNAGHRFDAARAAALAGTVADDSSGEVTKAKWRQQSHAWLRNELQANVKATESKNPRQRAYAVERLYLWKFDADLSAVRDADALGKLPDAEREEWRKFWADVDEVLKKAQS
jgi:serine/threonine-protein kinase